jgi:hypothetical protein
MLYLIGGAARAGKTTLARRLLRERGVSCFCVDYFVDALEQGAPALGVNSEDANELRAPLLWPLLEPMLRNIIEVEPAYTVEGDALSVEGVVEFLRAHPGQVRACFLGYAEITPEAKLAAIRRFPGGVNDWIQEHSDAYILDLAASMIRYSRLVRDDCLSHGLAYFDVSRDLPAAVARAYECLAEEV